jgi:hypothetical protein
MAMTRIGITCVHDSARAFPSSRENDHEHQVSIPARR